MIKPVIVVVGDVGEVIVPLVTAVHKPVPGDALLAAIVTGEPIQID